MRIVAPQTRQDHDISLRSAAALGTAALVLTALTLVPAAVAAAQGAVPCTAIDDDAQRLACYDRALRGTPAPPATAPAASTQVPNRSTPPAGAQAPAAPVAEAEPRPERRVRDSAAPRAPAAPAAGRDDGDDEQIVPIVVVGMRALPGRETTFTTQDGTSWVQTDSQRIVGLPDTPFDAEIKRGAMGSYFLVAKDRPRAIRVRPVR